MGNLAIAAIIGTLTTGLILAMIIIAVLRAFIRTSKRGKASTMADPASDTPSPS